MSALDRRLSITSLPSGFLQSMAVHSLLNEPQSYATSSNSVRKRMPHARPCVRCSSPVNGSTLMTLAPISARAREAAGPAAYWVRSITTVPSKPAMLFSPLVNGETYEIGNPPCLLKRVPKSSGTRLFNDRTLSPRKRAKPYGSRTTRRPSPDSMNSMPLRHSDIGTTMLEMREMSKPLARRFRACFQFLRV